MRVVTGMRGFLAELKRRNVVKVGVAYAATAWLVVEVASVLLPIFKAPTWVLQAFTTLVVLGFPIALVLAWALELTPEGLKRADEVTDADVAAGHASRRLDFVIIAVLVAAVAVLVVDRFFSAHPAGEPGSVADRPTAEAATPDAVAATPHALTAVAVLPFVNLSSDPEQEYFSDGLTEELLDRLSRIGTLKVPARASSFFFKGRSVDLREVGRALGVGAVLEGSVRKSGDRIRISAELSDTESGYRLWSETYDRTVADVFDVQAEITNRIAEALQIHLDQVSSLTDSTPPVAPEIHELMLRGLYYWNQRTPDGLKKAADTFKELIRRDPANAPGHAGLADVYLSEYDYGMLSLQESTAKARAAAERALELDKDLAASHTSIAHILLHEWQWTAAEAEFLKAIELDPRYVVAHHWHALCLTALGRVPEAVTTMERARELDPVSVRINADLGMAYLAAGRYDDAIAQEQHTLELSADAMAARWIRGMAFEQLQRYDEAESDMKAVLAAWPGDPSIMGSLGHLYAVAGREQESRALLAQLLAQKDPGVAFFIALVYAGLEQPADALAWLGRAIDERSGSVRYLQVDPRLARLRAVSGYAALIDRVGLPRN